MSDMHLLINPKTENVLEAPPEKLRVVTMYDNVTHS